MERALRLRIKTVPPLNFDLSAAIFAGGDPQIRTYENGKYWQVLRVPTKWILSTISSSGTVDEPELAVELQSNAAISNHDKKLTEEMIRSLFNLPFDLTAFYQEVKNDPILSNLTQQLRGLKMNKLEALPADDLGLRRHIAHYYCSDRRISGEEARSIAEG
ncbi:MAG: hypothetical protein EFT35_01180 [Methanophagales archaeon ANME-1-THS]|nr:MAG: hypothetical protein EFT35_01180 [Methanophagales archaeon ANME-1-THS]